MGSTDLARRHLYHALLIGICLVALACHPPRVVVMVPAGPPSHDIGLWLDDDLICVGLTPREALYVNRRCVPMKTIRAVILQMRSAEGAAPDLTFTRTHP